MHIQPAAVKNFLSSRFHHFFNIDFWGVSMLGTSTNSILHCILKYIVSLKTKSIICIRNVKEGMAFILKTEFYSINENLSPQMNIHHGNPVAIET